MNVIQAKHLFNRDQIAGKYETCSIHLDYNGNPILFSSIRDKKKNVHTIFHLTNAGVKKILTPPVEDDFHYAQPLGENWLLVNARVHDNRTHNAFLFNQNQELLSSFHMGDGIEDVQITPCGDIWVSYFDEGVFGESIGGSGLLCFDQQGSVTFDFETFIKKPRNKTIPYISDCYALNACSDETVYLYYYTDFPLLALHHKTSFELFQQKVLDETPIAGSHAFAVWNNSVLFGHGYKQKGKLHLFSRYGKEIQTFSPVNEKDEIFIYDYAVARAHTMLLIHKNDVYLVDMTEMM